MVNRGVHAAGAVILLAVLGLVVGGWIQNLATGGEGDREVRRTFVIPLPERIRANRERVPVEFGHELHTARIPDAKCSLCHDRGEDGSLDYTFVEGAADATREEFAEAYHDACISCHEERGRGPRACAECHFKVKPYVNAPWHDLELDFRQHQKHIDAEDGECGPCHHAWDEAAGALVHKEGEERSCRDCHRDEARENRPGLRTVAHRKCLSCHLERQEGDRPTGPTTCAGCHDDPGSLPVVTDMSDVPRLARSQPDTTVIRVDDLKQKSVPFDHRGHESLVRNCRACHHESLEACRNCHTLTGAAEGGHVKLADAYHRRTSSHSCVGCHEVRKKQRTCAICHGAMPPGPREASCHTCHSGPLAGAASVRPLTDPESLLPEDLPDDLKIDWIHGDLEPVEFPHRAIVKSMNDLIGASKLANVFHGTTAVVCAACHHHSPLGETPPSCARCHQDPFDPRELHRPGLKGAYHQQCIGCHRDMDVDMKVGDTRDCAGCHRDDLPMPGHVKGGGR